MTITPTRDFETIQQQVGEITGKIPGAWWVGTEKTLPMRDQYQEKWFVQKEAIKALAIELDCDPTKVWMNGGWGAFWYAGFTPNDLDNPDKALRRKSGHPSAECFVPNRRTKAGKALELRMEEINKSPEAPHLHRDFTGYRGTIIRPAGDGSMWHSELVCTTKEGFYPFLSVSENPDDNPYAENFEVDPELWERIPASWLARIIEESK
ncbi:hypothetical protein [Corynebacterium sp. A21]|uniref:hypothetical protein n=1 Tax=Corynebacterium sp. A21 TaxID=3457318 RepID=UPI003FD65DC3